VICAQTVTCWTLRVDMEGLDELKLCKQPAVDLLEASMAAAGLSAMAPETRRDRRRKRGQCYSERAALEQQKASLLFS
jgi:hypothetical protein